MDTAVATPKTLTAADLEMVIENVKEQVWVGQATDYNAWVEHLLSPYTGAFAAVASMIEEYPWFVPQFEIQAEMPEMVQLPDGHQLQVSCTGEVEIWPLHWASRADDAKSANRYFGQSYQDSGQLMREAMLPMILDFTHSGFYRNGVIDYRNLVDMSIEAAKNIEDHMKEFDRSLTALTELFRQRLQKLHGAEGVEILLRGGFEAALYWLQAVYCLRIELVRNVSFSKLRYAQCHDDLIMAGIGFCLGYVPQSLFTEGGGGKGRVLEVARPSVRLE